MDAIFFRSEFQIGRDPVEGRTLRKKLVGNFEDKHLIFCIKDVNLLSLYGQKISRP